MTKTYIYIYIEQTLVTSNGNSFFTPQICRCILSLSFIFPHKKKHWAQDPNKPSGWIHPFRIPLMPMQTFVTIASWEAPSTPEIYLLFCHISFSSKIHVKSKFPSIHSTDVRFLPTGWEKKSPNRGVFQPGETDRPSTFEKPPFEGVKVGPPSLRLIFSLSDKDFRRGEIEGGNGTPGNKHVL